MNSRTLRLQEAKLKTCQVCHLGLRPYAEVWALQQRLIQDRRVDSHLSDVLLLLEHWSVYTLGQGASLNFVNFTPGAMQPDLVRVERGGEVTYHCPGQLVGYPILNLHHHRLDLHWYMRQLEAVLIETLAQLGLRGERLSGLTGVWLEERKVAAIGIKVSRWITMHGFALNVCPDLAGFKQIVPCGLRDRAVGSLAEFLPGITVEIVQPLVEAAFAKVFRYQLEMQSPEHCRQLLASTQYCL